MGQLRLKMTECKYKEKERRLKEQVMTVELKN